METLSSLLLTSPNVPRSKPVTVQHMWLVGLLPSVSLVRKHLFFPSLDNKLLVCKDCAIYTLRIFPGEPHRMFPYPIRLWEPRSNWPRRMPEWLSNSKGYMAVETISPNSPFWIEDNAPETEKRVERDCKGFSPSQTLPSFPDAWNLWHSSN